MDLLDKKKRKENEKKFGTWEELPDGGRRYSYEIRGRYNWMARYVKEVDSMEKPMHPSPVTGSRQLKIQD